MRRNKDTVSVYQKKYYEDNKKRILERIKVDRENRPSIYSQRSKNHYQKVKHSLLKYRRNVRKQCIEAYGGKCVCCGENRFEFIAFDHVNGDGNKHRKIVGGGSMLPHWIKRNRFPAIFRLLCHNCNMSRGFYKYCPHEKS